MTDCDRCTSDWYRQDLQSRRPYVQSEAPVIHRPSEFAAFEFVVLASLRAVQLARGCTPRVTRAEKVAVTAQSEVAAGKVVRQPAPKL